MNKNDGGKNADAVSDHSEIRIPVIEEEVTVDKRKVARGTVRVHSIVREEEQFVRETLEHENVTIKRMPMEREIDTVPPVRTENDVTVVPVVEERLVVTRQLFLVEEIHLVKTLSKETVEIPVRLKRTDIEIDRR